MQSFLAVITPIGAHGLGDLRPDQGLPQPPMYPSQGLPGYGHPSHPIYSPPLYPSQGPIYGGGRPDQGLPGYGHPDQGLPGGGGHPDQGLPGGGGGSTLPVWNPIYGWFLMQIKQQAPHPDQGLPGSGGQPDNELPQTPEPK